MCHLLLSLTSSTAPQGRLRHEHEPTPRRPRSDDQVQDPSRSSGIRAWSYSRPAPFRPPARSCRSSGSSPCAGARIGTVQHNLLRAGGEPDPRHGHRLPHELQHLRSALAVNPDGLHHARRYRLLWKVYGSCPVREIHRQAPRSACASSISGYKLVHRLRHYDWKVHRTQSANAAAAEHSALFLARLIERSIFAVRDPDHGIGVVGLLTRLEHFKDTLAITT